MSQKIKTRGNLRKKLPLLLIFFIFAATCVTIFIVSQKRDNITPAPTTSDANTAKSTYKQGRIRPISSGSTSQGTAIDQNGKLPDRDISSANSGVSSSGGSIKLASPAANTLVKSGDYIYGSSSLPSVQYRIADNTKGQLAQGSLKVVDGYFSGKLEFNPVGDSGKLDVYSIDSSTGKELDKITLSVRF